MPKKESSLIERLMDMNGRQIARLYDVEKLIAEWVYHVGQGEIHFESMGESVGDGPLYAVCNNEGKKVYPNGKDGHTLRELFKSFDTPSTWTLSAMSGPVAWRMSDSRCLVAVVNGEYILPGQMTLDQVRHIKAESKQHFPAPAYSGKTISFDEYCQGIVDQYNALKAPKIPTKR